jgi:hypothetical protein
MYPPIVQYTYFILDGTVFEIKKPTRLPGFQQFIFYLRFFLALSSSISRLISSRFLVLWERVFLFLPTPVALFAI